MAVLQCGNCGAPRNPRSPRCEYCGSHFADPTTGRSIVEVDRDIERLLRAKNKIEAIKIYRERHKTGLAEAKDAIEALEKRLGL